MTNFVSYLEASQGELAAQLLRHIFLVGLSVFAAVAIGIPVGIFAAHRPRIATATLGVANVLQTVPSLAMFGFLIPLPLIGGADARPAIIALALYALLPIIKNTITGLRNVDPAAREAAIAMGMTPSQLLWQVELPLSLPLILAGVRIAAVICVGTATIAAAAGAEGLGVFIFRGLESYNTHALLAGAIPAALLALAIDGLLALLERANARRAGGRVATPRRTP